MMSHLGDLYLKARSLGLLGAGLAVLMVAFVLPRCMAAEGDWEITPESEKSLSMGLEWLAKNQGPKGDWDNPNLGLVSMATLAFLADGHMPGRGKYGRNVEKALDFIVTNAKPSGLLNIANKQHDMYNHGLSTFVLGQAYGMTRDKRLGKVLDRALRLIEDSQCDDGGWDYHAIRKPVTRDLSLCVMQAKALRSAMDSGLKVQPEVIEKAIRSVRTYYYPDGGFKAGEGEEQWKKRGGAFSYRPRDKGRISLAMTACGVVALQEFGQYDDWRISSAMQTINRDIKKGDDAFRRLMKNTFEKKSGGPGADHVPFDAYTLYYLGQAIYQRGGQDWKECYPVLRDGLVRRQRKAAKNPTEHGCWRTKTWWMKKKESQLYGTSIACFVLAIPNRYLPILQEGEISGLKKGQPTQP